MHTIAPVKAGTIPAMSIYTTGQASGVTGIPIKTIQRFIRQFPEAFSEAARKHDKGRRYTDQDIKHLLIIRQLMQRRAAPEEIRQALTSSSPDVLPIIEIETALQIAKITHQTMLEAQEHANRSQISRALAESSNASIKQELRELAHDIEALEEKVYKLNMMLPFAKKKRGKEPTPEPLDQHDKLSKKSWWERWLDG